MLRDAARLIRGCWPDIKCKSQSRRSFTLHNETKLQLRAEVSNPTNTPNFVVPNAQAGNPSFGAIASSGNNTPRQMQFAAKFLF